MPAMDGNGPNAEQIPHVSKERTCSSLALPNIPYEQVTPFRLAVVALVLEYGVFKQKNKTEPSERIRMCTLLLSLIQGPDLSLTQLIKRFHDSEPPKGLESNWGAQLSNLAEDGPSEAMAMFFNIEREMQANPPSIGKSSVLGLTVRRYYLEYERLSFSQVSNLQNQYNKYYLKGMNAIFNYLLTLPEERRNSFDPMASEYHENFNLSSVVPTAYRRSVQDGRVDSPGSEAAGENSDEDQPKECISRKQAGFFIAQQSGYIEHNEMAAMPPSQLEKELNAILKSNPGLQEAYFLSYLNCLRLKEVVGAMDNLYSTFCQLASLDQDRVGGEDIAKAGQRHANLNLATLHARFGHNKEALHAIRESITISQDAKDHSGLQYALTWLSRLKPHNNIPLLERCFNKCDNIGLNYLAALGMLSVASQPEKLSHKPRYVFDLLTRSANYSSVTGVLDVHSSSLLMRANVWAKFGRPQLAAVVAQLLLLLNTSDPTKSGVFYLGEPVALAFSNIALHFDSEGHPSEADCVVRHMEKLFPFPESQFSNIVEITTNRIKFTRALRKNNWSQAEQAIQYLTADSLDRDYLQALLLFRRGDFSAARDIVQDIIQNLDKQDEQPAAAPPEEGVGFEGSRELMVRCYILLADVKSLCNDTGGAIQNLMDAVRVASKYRLDLMYALACLHLANLHLLMGQAAKGLHLARRCLGFLLSHGDLTDRSRGWLLIAKCRIAAATERPETERRRELMDSALHLEVAKKGFSAVEDWERLTDCFYLQARLYHALDLPQERNMAAQHYKQVTSMHPVVTNTSTLLLI